jgi:hypothetical protein
MNRSVLIEWKQTHNNSSESQYCFHSTEIVHIVRQHHPAECQKCSHIVHFDHTYNTVTQQCHTSNLGFASQLHTNGILRRIESRDHWACSCKGASLELRHQCNDHCKFFQSCASMNTHYTGDPELRTNSNHLPSHGLHKQQLSLINRQFCVVFLIASVLLDPIWKSIFPKKFSRGLEMCTWEKNLLWLDHCLHWELPWDAPCTQWHICWKSLVFVSWSRSL